MGAPGESVSKTSVSKTSVSKTSVSKTFFLEDLEVGQRFSSASHTVDESQIKAFAGQFDPQPFHLDAEAAKKTLFGGLAASGWHTAAITMKLLVESGLPLAGGIIGSGGEISWPKPVRPGDTLTVFSQIEEVTPSRSRPDRGMVRVRSETRNQHGEIVQLVIPKLVVPRRTTAAAQDSSTPRPTVTEQATASNS
jgi:acyl dehydratase